MDSICTIFCQRLFAFTKNSILYYSTFGNLAKLSLSTYIHVLQSSPKKRNDCIRQNQVFISVQLWMGVWTLAWLCIYMGKWMFQCRLWQITLWAVLVFWVNFAQVNANMSDCATCRAFYSIMLNVKWTSVTYMFLKTFHKGYPAGRRAFMRICMQMECLGWSQTREPKNTVLQCRILWLICQD